MRNGFHRRLLRSSGRLRPSPSSVLAVLALIAALGGTGYAAFRLPKGSVGTSQLKDGAVTARKVRLHSLLAVDFKPGQLRSGANGTTGGNGAAGGQGPAGTQGAPGPAGAAGTARAYGVVSAAGALNSARSKAIASVSKPAGTFGIYCVALAAGIDPASTTIVAVPDNSDPASSSKAIAQVDSSAADCPAGRLEVETRKLAIDTTVPGQIVAHHSDNGFSFVVP